MTAASDSRSPAVAGLFYPADPDRLGEQVDELLDSASPRAFSGPVRVIVSPHAGYPYSGALAARGFRQLDSQDYHTIVMIGPSHVEAFNFASVYTGGSYETPLGKVDVNTTLARRIAAEHPDVRASEAGHVQTQLSRGEHSLEVQLPFLQRTNPGAEIVAIVMGDKRWDLCVALGEVLARTCDEGVVILASSDLSHFYNYDDATRLDTAFCDVLETLDARALYDAVRAGRCEACGAGPVIAALLATEGVARRDCHVLARTNSGDVTGDRNSVVGYTSAVVTAGSA